MKKFNIILEGCDGVGKTTTYNLLLKRGIVVAGTHTGPPKSKEEFKKQARKDIKFINKTDGWVFDRFLLGECVYGPIVRNYYPEYMRKFEKKIKSHNILIVLTASYETVLKRFDGKFLTRHQLKDCLARYLEQFRLCNYNNKILIDTTSLIPDEVVNKITVFLSEVDKAYGHDN